MKLKIILGILISIFIFASSCQKQINGLDPLPPTPVDSVKILDSSYLDKVILLDDNGIDTFELQTFNYDANKRLVLITDTTKSGGTISPGFTRYFYNGNDTLPYKKVYVSAFEQFDSVVTYLFYDNAGKKTADSSRRFAIATNIDTLQQEYVTRYKYSADKIYGDLKNIEFSNNFKDSTFSNELDTAIVDINSNILSIIHGAFQAPKRLDYFTYDTHTNPYFKLNILKTEQLFPEFHFGLAKNNLLTGDVQDNSVSDPTARIKDNYVYTYNSSGLPLTLKDIYTKGSNTYTDVYLYKYKAL
jgi:hypothetical protein